MPPTDDFLADYRDDVAQLFAALTDAHQAAVGRAAGLSSGVERTLRATTDLIGRSLATLAKSRKPALLWFGGGAVIALIILLGFRDNPQALVWSDLVRPMLLLATVFFGAPTAVLGWRHLRPVYARWWGNQSDRWAAQARLELFFSHGAATALGKLDGTLVTLEGCRTGRVDHVETVVAAGESAPLVFVRLPNGDLLHLLNATRLQAETWFNGLEFMTARSRDYSKALVDECRQTGVLDALAELQKLLGAARKHAGGGKTASTDTGSEIKSSSPTPLQSTGSASSWDSLILDDEFKDRLQTTVAALRNAKLLRAQGFEPPSSLLLYGPPGTGKTEVARTLANMSGMSFFAAKGSDVRARYLGHSAPLIKELFAQAREHSPAIVFLDELDIVAARRDADQGEKDRLSDELVGELLVELDGVVKAEGDVFFMAATNFPEKVDAALLNRFRERREVPLPSMPARLAMLHSFLAGKPCEDDVPSSLEALALQADGRSGRDLRNLVNAAAERAVSRALKENRIDRVIVSAADLAEAAWAQHAAVQAGEGRQK